MADLYFTTKAVEDLNDIWSYTVKKWSEKQADLYYQLLLDNCKNIAGNPTVGKPYQDILPNLYGLKVNRHVIFYRMLDSEIEISRILHERMDLRNRMRG